MYIRTVFIACCLAVGLWAFQAPADSGFGVQLNSLVTAFAGNFESIKGEKSYAKDSSTAEWKSTVQLQGASETYIVRNYPTDKHLTLVARYKNYTTREKAVSEYKALVAQVKACRFTAGEMVAAEGHEAGKLYTDFELKSGKKGNSDYSSLVLRVKLVDHKYDEGFYFYSLGLLIYKK